MLALDRKSKLVSGEFTVTPFWFVLDKTSSLKRRTCNVSDRRVFLHMLTGCRWIHTTVVTSGELRQRKLISTTCVFDLIFLVTPCSSGSQIDGEPLLISRNQTAFCSHLSQPDPVVEKQLVLITCEKVFLPSSPFTIKAPHSECKIDFVFVS